MTHEKKELSNEEKLQKRIDDLMRSLEYEKMRSRLNRMSEETFQLFLDYQKAISERRELIGAGSHVVDVVQV